MSKLERAVIYFTEPGDVNTNDVVDVVTRKVRNSGPGTVVVASTSGETGKIFSESLEGKAKVIVISHREIVHQCREQIERVGGIAVDRTDVPLSTTKMSDVKNTLKILGQGFKVALEVIIIATERKLVEPYTDVIGVGGSGKGADTALVARTTTRKDMFSEDEWKKLEVREIMAMPLKKKWW